METMHLYISVITSVITLGTMIYNILAKKIHKREKAYYQKILQQYIKKLVINPDVSSVDVVKNKVKREDDNIPKYICFLIDNNMEEKLKKVLVYDYLSLYPNDDNSIEKMGKFVTKILYYMLFFLTLFLMFYGVALSIIALFDVISLWCDGIYGTLTVDGNEYEDCQWSLMCLEFGIFSIGLSFVFGRTNKCINRDMYSLRLKEINKIINYKVRKFDKKRTQFFI